MIALLGALPDKCRIVFCAAGLARSRNGAVVAGGLTSGKSKYLMKTSLKKITLQTLADQLGISTATVSRALKNHRAINSGTRARVMAEAVRLGYDRPIGADAARNETLRVLLLLPPNGRVTSSPVFPQYLRGITTAANVLGCALSIEEIPSEHYGRMDLRANLPRAIRNEEADVVVLSGQHDSRDVSALARARPVVSIQWDYDGEPADLVTAFNAAGTAAAVHALAARGHRRLVWVDGPIPSSFYRERQAGFIQGCLRAGIPLEAGMFLPHDGVDAARLRALVVDGVTAVVGSNDDVAQRISVTCLQIGIRIPEDLSLTGFDGTRLPLGNGKYLTTYDPGLSEIGHAAIEAAVQRVRATGASRMIHSRGGCLLEGETMKIF